MLLAIIEDIINPPEMKIKFVGIDIQVRTMTKQVEAVKISDLYVR